MAGVGHLSMRGGHDFFGEEQSLIHLAEFLCAKGVDVEAVCIQCLLLEFADTSLPIPETGADDTEQAEPLAPGNARSLEQGVPKSRGSTALQPPDFGLGGWSEEQLVDIFGAPAGEQRFPPLPLGVTSSGCGSGSEVEVTHLELPTCR